MQGNLVQGEPTARCFLLADRQLTRAAGAAEAWLLSPMSAGTSLALPLPLFPAGTTGGAHRSKCPSRKPKGKLF